MYAAAPSAVGAKLVSIDPPVQAAAGLGAVDVADLPVGDLGACGNLPTGTPCRGVELGGILAHCTCINLSETPASIELKQMVTDVTGLSTDGTAVWTSTDQAALLAWADEASGLYLPDVRRWWKSGWVSVDDLLQRTASEALQTPGLPGAYPTGAGILALADAVGCLVDGDTGLQLGPGCARFPALSSAITRYFSILTPNPEEGISVYPPTFGEPPEPPPEVIPGGDPYELLARLPDARRGGLEWLGWLLAGAAVAAAVILPRRKRRAGWTLP